jgi:protein TonB
MFTTMALPRDRIGIPGRRPASMGPAALLAVAALHAGLIAAILLLAGRTTPPPPPPEPGVAMIFAQPAPPPAAPTQLATTTLRPPATAVIASLSPTPPVAIVHAVPAPRPHPARTHPQPSRDTPPAAAPFAPAQFAPPSTPQPSAAPAALAGWEARIRQAVQDAAIYPEAARLRRREGQAEVQFAYAQGAVAGVSIVRTSTVTALDTAALAAVTQAKMPAPPPGLGSQPRTLRVWVRFALVSGG